MSNQDSMTEDEFWAILAAAPEPQPIFYRLYHDEQGQPLFYTMEDVPGTYIEITQEQHAAGAFNVRVENGKLITITWVTTEKLEPTDTGTACHPDNVAIVVSQQQTHQCWSKQTYEHKS